MQLRGLDVSLNARLPPSKYREHPPIGLSDEVLAIYYLYRPKGMASKVHSSKFDWYGLRQASTRSFCLDEVLAAGWDGRYSSTGFS